MRSSHEFPPCQYQSLPNARHIRLLRLILTGDEEAPGCYKLVPADLDGVPMYNALSYTWGDPFAYHNGARETQIPSVFTDGTSFASGQNLYRALIRFQELRIFGDLWIDAVCINQNDIEERNA